jgi:hypothetical protein
MLGAIGVSKGHFSAAGVGDLRVWFPPKETLKNASWEAANSTERTLV